MAELLQANWILVVIALVIGLLVAWWIFVASRRTKVEVEHKEDDSDNIAKRNHALIDAPPAAQKDDGMPATAATDAQDAEAARTAASPGATSAAANADSTAASPLGTDAETGDGVPMREAMKEMDTQEHGEAPSPAPAQATPAPTPAPAPAPAPTPAPAPAATPATAPASTTADASDDLRRIKGVGPKLVTMLHEQGVTSFAQIAAWNDADIDRVDAALGRFQGRIRRDSWVEQASLLQSGDTAAYEAKFGRTS